MTHSRGVGGSEQHDLRREGTVTPRDHNLRRGGGTTSPEQAKLEDPNRPHQPKSGREMRREAERAEAHGSEAGEPSAEPGSDGEAGTRSA